MAGVGALLVGRAEAAGLVQGVRAAVQKHGGRGRGDDGHGVAHPGLDVVVPFVIRHRDEPWGGT